MLNGTKQKNRLTKRVKRFFFYVELAAVDFLVLENAVCKYGKSRSRKAEMVELEGLKKHKRLRRSCRSLFSAHFLSAFVISAIYIVW